MAASGWYLDLVLQGTYYNGNAITQFANLPINGSGFISSLEGGYPIPLPLGPRFVWSRRRHLAASFVQPSQRWARSSRAGHDLGSDRTGRLARDVDHRRL